MPGCVLATLVQDPETPLLKPRVPLTNRPITTQCPYPTSQQGHAWSFTLQKRGRCPPPGYARECPQQLNTLVTAPQQRGHKCPLTREQTHTMHCRQKQEYQAATGRKPRPQTAARVISQTGG